jgi:hypothetical protein
MRARVRTRLDFLSQDGETSGGRAIIERVYVEEFVDLAWQIARLKRCKAGVINLAFHQASKNILWEPLEAGPESGFVAE